MACWKKRSIEDSAMKKISTIWIESRETENRNTNTELGG